MSRALKTVFRALEFAAALGISMLATEALATPIAGTGGIHYASPTGDFIGQGLLQSWDAPPGTLTLDTNLTTNAVQAVLDMGAGNPIWTLTLAAPDGARLAVGLYDATRFPSTKAGVAGLDFAGDGRSCTLSTSIFDVLQVTYDVNGNVTSLAVDFDQSCENTQPTLIGQFRFNSSIAFTPIFSGGYTGSLGGFSTRGLVLPGNDALIGGFVIGGTTSKTVVVRARGPSLAAAGVASPLANPALQLVRSSDGVTVAINDDWQTAANAAAVSASGFAPGDPLEAAILMTLAPGGYTAVVTGTGGTTGVGIVEIYEIDHPESPLINISTRGQTQTGENVMIGGFTVQGGPLIVAMRARGPSLFAQSVTGTLVNPQLTLVDVNGKHIGFNDDWKSQANFVELINRSVQPSFDLEAALLVALQPGNYTIVMTGGPGDTGVGIVELFALH